MMRLVRRRIVDPIVALLRQGITPERIALSLACGAILGIFPVHAVVGWLVLGPIAVYVLYRALLPVLARASRRFRPRPAI